METALEKADGAYPLIAASRQPGQDSSPSAPGDGGFFLWPFYRRASSRDCSVSSFNLMPLKVRSMDRASSCSVPRDRRGRSLPIVTQLPVPMCTRPAIVLVPRRTSSCRSARSNTPTWARNPPVANKRTGLSKNKSSASRPNSVERRAGTLSFVAGVSNKIVLFRIG
jgi:hypothetical protein